MLVNPVYMCYNRLCVSAQKIKYMSADVWRGAYSSGGPKM